MICREPLALSAGYIAPRFKISEIAMSLPRQALRRGNSLRVFATAIGLS